MKCVIAEIMRVLYELNIWIVHVSVYVSESVCVCVLVCVSVRCVRRSHFLFARWCDRTTSRSRQNCMSWLAKDRVERAKAKIGRTVLRVVSKG